MLRGAIIGIIGSSMGFVGGSLVGSSAGRTADHHVRREFEEYRDRVDLCATTAESGETLRACIKEAHSQW